MLNILALVAPFVAGISYYLFKSASGTLSLGKLNIVSCVYYILVLQTFTGAILVTLGYNKHYTLGRLVYGEQSIEISILAVYIMMIFLPLVIIATLKLFKVSISDEYSAFLDKEVKDKHNNKLFVLTCIAAIIQFALLIQILTKIGYIPFIKIFFHDASFNFELERIHIAKDLLNGFSQILIKIIVLLGIPLVSYISMAYALLNREVKWYVIAIFYFCAAIITQTLDFSKSPLIVHLFIYLLIFIYYKGGVRFRYIAGFICLASILLIIFYKKIGNYSGSFFDIYNGILGRTIFTQFGTLCYHFELFPKIFCYLGGRSFSPTILKVLGENPEEHLRSAQLVMDFYGSKGVYSGGAGVMNTVFIGEAYANWGFLGLAFSILWVGFFIGAIFVIILKIKKTPATIAFLAVMTKTLMGMVEGGFVDFIYNISVIITIVGFLIVIYFDNIYINILNVFNKLRKQEWP